MMDYIEKSKKIEEARASGKYKGIVYDICSWGITIINWDGSVEELPYNEYGGPKETWAVIRYDYFDPFDPEEL